MPLQDKYIKRTALCGLLTALAIVVSAFESLLPVQAVIPLPGLKLGIANIVTVYALYYIGNKEAFIILLCRCAVVGVLFGNLTSFLFSVCGGLLALFAMCAMKKFGKERFSFIGVSIVGAASHNTGQILASCAVLKTLGTLYYLPPLLLASVVCGGVTGTVLCLLPELKNLKITK